MTTSDGARIVFTRQRLRHGDPKGALFVANADGTGLRQITPFGVPDPDEVPKWSPDGTEILFGSATEKLVAVHPDGTGVRGRSRLARSERRGSRSSRGSSETVQEEKRQEVQDEGRQTCEQEGDRYRL